MMKLPIVFIIFLSSIVQGFAQECTFLVDIERKEYFVSSPHFFQMYDSTGYTKLYYSNDENNQSDTMIVYPYHLNLNPSLTKFETFKNLTRNNHLKSIPRINVKDLTYKIEFKDSLPGKEFPCSQASEAKDVMNYNYTSRIYYKKLLIFEQAYVGSNLRSFWNYNREMEYLSMKSMVFIDEENKKLYSLIDNLDIFDLGNGKHN